MRIAKLHSAKELLDIAVRKGFRAQINAQRRSALARKKVVEATRISIMEEEIVKRLTEFVKAYPSIEKLPQFEREMISILADEDSIRKSLGHLTKTSRIIQKIRKEATRRIFSAMGDVEVMKGRKQFMARTSSVMGNLQGSIDEINNSSKKFLEIPDLKDGCINVLLAGFPNVGKTTLLGRITGSRAEIASYPFTTKRMNLGYFDNKYVKFQVIDTPGLLDKSMKKMNNIEKKTMLALRHVAHIVVYVADPSGHCGFDINEQASLFKEIRGAFDKEFMVVLNKADITREKEMEEAYVLFPGAIIEGEKKSAVKEEIIRTFDANRRKFLKSVFDTQEKQP